MYKILIIEDDQIIARALKNHLDKWELETQIVADFQHILDQFVTYDPQLVLLDISLPFFNGYHWCSEIRKISKVPIIFISSTSDNMNIVMAMNMGGDDFIAKPFDLTVVVAKIQALLRRTYSFQGQVSLLNVWASWCVSCRQEHPLLLELAKAGQVPIYGLNYKDQRDDALGWLGRLGNPYRASAFDADGKVGIDWGVYGVPETFVIDRKGIIRYKFTGPLTREAWDRTLLPLIQKLQAEPA